MPRILDLSLVFCVALGLALAASLNAPIPQHPRFGLFRM